MLAWGLGAAVVAAVLAGAVPALRASRLDPIDVLKSAGPKSSAGRGERRLLRGVTMVQTALTLALLVGAGLLIRTMINIAKVQSGYNTGRHSHHDVTAVQGDWADFHRRALERVSALPGVQNAAFAWGVPLTGNNWPATVEIEGQPAATKAERPHPDAAAVRHAGLLRAAGSAGFPRAGISARPMTRGAPSVAVVNQALADRYFPHAQSDREEDLGQGAARDPLRRSSAWWPMAAPTI